jgi:hypothetical protein
MVRGLMQLCLCSMLSAPRLHTRCWCTQSVLCLICSSYRDTTYTAIICITYIFTIELGLAQPLIDDIVYVAPPHGGCCPRRYLRRILCEYLPEVLCAFPAAIPVSLRMTFVCATRCKTYQGYRRWNRCTYDRSASCSSSVGLSGKRAKVVCKTFHAARPSSALRLLVSLPVFCTWCLRSGCDAHTLPSHSPTLARSHVR